MSLCEIALFHYQTYLTEIKINLKFYFTTKGNRHMRYRSPIFKKKLNDSKNAQKMRLITLPIDNI